MKISLWFKTLLLSILLFSPSVVVAAAESSQKNGSSMLLILFVGFFALIVVFQLVPAILMFSGIVKGLFAPKDRVAKSSNVKS